jgi:RNA polymerase sigma-70 factor (ECF subfamily)
MNERDLVNLCIAQLPYITQAYTELVKRYENYVYSLCFRYLCTKEQAEDASQDVFLKVFHALPKFQYKSAFKTWLYSIVINHCNTLLAKRKKERERYNATADLDQFSVEQHQETAHCVEAQSDKLCVHQVIENLESEERNMILLRFNSELGLSEIADVMDKKLSATKMKFYRSLEKFKRLYQQLCE